MNFHPLQVPEEFDVKNGILGMLKVICSKLMISIIVTSKKDDVFDFTKLRQVCINLQSLNFKTIFTFINIFFFSLLEYVKIYIIG
jgi:hypothetical protein